MMRRMFVLGVLLFSVYLGSYSYGLMVSPSNIQMPDALGGIFSFDLIVSSGSEISNGIQTTIGIQNTGALSFDSNASEEVINNSNYWVYGNSTGSPTDDNGDGTYTFGDAPDDAEPQNISQGEIIARYSFVFNGPIDWYTFSIDFDTAKSFSQNENFGTDAIGWNKGDYQGTATGFDVYITPEPASLLLLGLGGFLIRKK